MNGCMDGVGVGGQEEGKEGGREKVTINAGCTVHFQNLFSLFLDINA